jgi:hypothetical protein
MSFSLSSHSLFPVLLSSHHSSSDILEKAVDILHLLCILVAAGTGTTANSSPEVLCILIWLLAFGDDSWEYGKFM